MMPLADMFQPDINFTPARAVYPTARGGTVANAGGAMTTATSVHVTDPSTGDVQSTVGETKVALTGHPIAWWVGTLGLLVLLVFVARKAGGEEDFRNIRPTGYNFATITLTSIVGIVMLKVLAAKYPIPGASQLILAV